MKKLVLILSLFTITCSAQNLVPNPSFENYTDTIIAGDTFCNCTQWYSPTDLEADYFNQHTTGVVYGVPNNYMGYRTPHAGSAYFGLGIRYIYNASDSEGGVNQRQYIQTKLLDSLSKGVKYCVSFYVTLTDSAAYATDGIAAYFSDTDVTHHDSLLFPYYRTLNYNPQVFNPHGNIISDKQNWTLISGSFIAKGGEQYITIGNFWDDANTDTIWVGGGYRSAAPESYLYIDDVSVSADTSTCLSTVVNEISHKEDVITISPNPASSEIQVISNQSSVTSIEVYNMLGEKVSTLPLTDYRSPITINIAALPSGMYFVKIKSENGVAVKKFIKE